jgi:hypothetical protein
VWPRCSGHREVGHRGSQRVTSPTRQLWSEVCRGISIQSVRLTATSWLPHPEVVMTYRKITPEHTQTKGTTVLLGLESAIIDTATSAAFKAISSGKSHFRTTLDRRAVKQELASGPNAADIRSLINSIDSGIAQQLASFTSSAEVGNIALNLAIGLLFKRCGSREERLIKALKHQLRTFLSLNTTLVGPDLEAAAELLFAALYQTVDHNIAGLIGEDKAITRAAKTSILKMQDSIIGSTMRNSQLLNVISNLASFKSFEDDLNAQTRNLYGTMRLPHAGATRRVPYDKLYVEPTVQFVTSDPRIAGITDETLNERQARPVQNIASDILRIALLGDPGGGKSTLSLKLTYDCASGRGLSQTTVPFLVVLREYAAELSKGSLPLTEYISQVCQMPLSVTPPEGAIEYLLLNGRALVIFDGLDELLDTALRRQVVNAVEGFAYRYPTTPILVTSRRVGYHDAPLDSELFNAVRLAEFSTTQVEAYAKKWFDLDDSEAASRRVELCKSFIADSSLVMDLRVNPLMLSLMCGIYATEHYIPRNRPDVYEKCALLLFDTWDKQRGVKPALSFDAHVQAAMRSLALWLYPQQLSKHGLPRTLLISHMTEYLLKKRFDNDEEAENAAVEFVDFCKGRAWVLTDVGADLYGFTHRTFLEYFAASQIVRENTNPAKLFDYLVERLRTGGWEVVAQLALQILNKAVEDGADNFLDILLTCAAGADTEPALRAKLLEFAAQSLAYIVPRPSVLRDLTRGIIDFVCEQHRDEEFGKRLTTFALLLAASPENLALIAKYAYQRLAERLSVDNCDESALYLALHGDLHSYPSTPSNSGYTVSNDNHQFWSEQREAQFWQFQEFAKLQSSTLGWVAVNLMERDLLSGYELVERFGAQVLFSSRSTGDNASVSQVVPFAFKFVLSYASPDRTVVEGIETRIGPQGVDSLLDALISTPVPWSMSSSDPFFGRDILRLVLPNFGFLPSGSSLGLFLLFVACLYEGPSTLDIRTSHVSPYRSLGGGRPDMVSRILLARDRLMGAGDRGSRLENATVGLGRVPRDELVEAGVDERTAILLERWTSDSRFCFMDIASLRADGKGIPASGVAGG